MVAHLKPSLRAQKQSCIPVKLGQDTNVDEQSERKQPLMRKFEIVTLLPCGATRASHHLAPATELFEATSAAFARGTMISTPLGPIAIEDLSPGDLIETVDGDPQPVLWIGSTSFIPAQVLPNSSLKGLTRVLADGYSNAGMFGDLLLGPAARLLQSRPALENLIGVSAVLMPARDLEDGNSAFRVTPPSPVRLFHLRLARHAAIYAGGRPVEAYHPGRGFEHHLGDNMRTLFMSLFPDLEKLGDFGPLAYPRMSRETLESLTRG